MDIKIGFCQRCGKTVKLIDPGGKTQRDWDRQATEKCACMKIKAHGRMVVVQNFEQLSLFDLMQEIPDIKDIPEEEAVRIVGERIGAKFEYNPDFEEWQARISDLKMGMRYEHYFPEVQDGKLFLEVSFEFKNHVNGGGSPCDGIDEAVEFFKDKMELLEKRKQERKKIRH